MPILPGTTARVPPLTPLFAGTHLIRPLTCGLVHAACVHNAEDIADERRRDHPIASQRVHTAVRERRAHDGKIADVTLTEHCSR